jgi:membrane protein
MNAEQVEPAGHSPERGDPSRRAAGWDSSLNRDDTIGNDTPSPEDGGPRMAPARPGGRTGASASAGTQRPLARARDRAAATAERARERAAGAAERARSGAVGTAQTRMRDLAISHHALVFSALGMVLFVPALISLATLLPLGSDHGLAARMAHHMALSPEAQEAVRGLFSTADTIRTPTSAVGAVFTVLAAYAWPAELQRFYQAVWGLPSLGFRQLWRPLVWLGSLLVIVAAVAVVGGLAGGVSGALLTAALCSPLVLLWIWWMQRFLLAGRVPWSALLPSALVTAAGLAAFSVATSVYLSHAIVWNADKYGPIGVVFVLMSWLTWFSTVLLGGAVVGHFLHQRRNGSSG